MSKYLKDLKKINFIHALVYPIIFIIISIVFVTFHITTGNGILDIAIIMLITGILDVFTTFGIHEAHEGRKGRRK
jgi:hypothetical protein